MDGCTFGLHKWGKWEVIERGDVLRTDRSMIELVQMGVAKQAPPTVIGHYITQSRKCARCGLEQIAQQKTRL